MRSSNVIRCGRLDRAVVTGADRRAATIVAEVITPLLTGTPLHGQHAVAPREPITPCHIPSHISRPVGDHQGNVARLCGDKKTPGHSAATGSSIGNGSGGGI